MPSDSLPDEVRRLLDERAQAREERDWARADALRDEIAALGWEVQDSGDGSSARPVLPTAPAVPLDDVATVAASLHVVAEDHQGDLERFVRGLASYPPSASWELVVVDNGARFDLREVALPVPPVLVRSSERLGWADARTLALQHSRGEVTVLLDTSLEPTGDFVTPLLGAFEDSSVGIAGPWGVTSSNGRQFEEAPPGEVDAIQAYCLAVRREALREVRGFDRRFRFYRNADLDFSFAVRAAGWRAMRTPPLALERHEHRGWASLPEDERERVSRRNFYRFLDRWGHRRDLLLHPDPADR